MTVDANGYDKTNSIDLVYLHHYLVLWNGYETLPHKCT